jgi:hypothetical protein
MSIANSYTNSLCRCVDEFCEFLNANCGEDKIMKNTLLLRTLAIGFLSFGTFALADGITHNYVNTTRSSYISKIFVSQSIEGEFGSMKVHEDSTIKNMNASTSDTGAKWQGYNLTSTLGLEIMKFVQFNASHSSVNMKSVKSNLEKLDGSRFSGGLRLVFQAPVANLELGGGVIGTRYDYQKELQTAGFYGSGVYYSLGMNYFTTDQVSVFGVVKLVDEHSVKNSGNSDTQELSLQSTNAGIGVTLWL